MAATGVASTNFDGTTIHTALNIPINQFGKYFPPLFDEMRSSLKNKLSDLKLLMIKYQWYLMIRFFMSICN